MAVNFTKKTIRVTVALGQGVFSSGGSVKVMEGLPTEAMITKPNLPEQNSAGIRIWGLSLDDMRQMTMLAFRPLENNYNMITVEAGDQGGKLSVVFYGNITAAAADFNEAPDPVMTFEAQEGYFTQQKAPPATVVKSEVTADSLFTQWTAEAGMTYKNEGVTVSIKNSHFAGSPIDKIKQLANNTGCNLIFDNGVCIVYPGDKVREGDPPFLSKDTGLIGYPTFNQEGVTCNCLFNPAINLGGRIQIASIVPKATGMWYVKKLDHNISANIPGGGPWETHIEASYEAGAYL